MNLSCFFWEFTAWIAEEAIKRDVRELYFFTREGEFFKELYDTLRNDSPHRNKMPRAQLAEVSRRSVFLPSMQEISIGECRRIWAQYYEQSMEAFCKTLSIEIDQIEETLKKYEIQKEEIIKKPWKDDRVKALFEDKEFQLQLKKQRDRSRSLLYRYLEQKGWGHSGTQRIGVVDIGWRGSIQDSLCRLYPDLQIVGFYIGLQPFLVRQPANAVKIGYIDGYKNKDQILLTVRPLEMLCNSASGSTQGYQMRNGRAYAVKKVDFDENRIYELYAGKIQKKICADKKTCRWVVKRHGSRIFTDQAARRYTAGLLYRFIAYPDRRSTKAYFSLKHNEEFGKGKFISMKTRFYPGLFCMAWFGRRYRRKLKETLKETAWPQGYFVRYRLYPLLIPYNILLRYYLTDKRKNMIQTEG